MATPNAISKSRVDTVQHGSVEDARTESIEKQPKPNHITPYN